MIVAGSPGTVLTCATTDALSGVMTPATGSNVTVRVNGLPTTTLTCTGAETWRTTRGLRPRPYIAPYLHRVPRPGQQRTDRQQRHRRRTYPIKFQLTGIDGLPITVLPAVASTTYTTGPPALALATAREPSSGTSVLTFDATTNTFQYNWKTPTPEGCYEFVLGLADGTTKTALFNLK